LSLAGKALKGLKALWTTSWNGIKTAAQAVWNTIRGLFDDFGSKLVTIGSTAISRIRSFFSGGWTAIRSNALDALRTLRDTVKTWIGKAVEQVKKLPGKARTALGDLGNTLRNAGIALIQGFIDGIGSMIDNVRDTLGDLTDLLPDIKGPPEKDRVLLFDAGRLVIDGFINGLESRYDAVRKSLRGLTDDVASTELAVPGAGQINGASGISSAVASAIDTTASQAGGDTKILNYYAAPNSSLPAEEDLFAASNRARFAWG
jgi:phage-related protein